MTLAGWAINEPALLAPASSPCHTPESNRPDDHVYELDADGDSIHTDASPPGEARGTCGLQR
jgi:hypothetical protein